ncbi:MAG: glutamine synthetase adenylyltransferase [Planctomycetaceae bacterium]
MFENAASLIEPSPPSDVEVERLLTSAGFSDWRAAFRRLREMTSDEATRGPLADCLPMLLMSLSEAATPDGSLINFERYAQSVSDPPALFRYLATNPRAVEILIKLFVGSQFLTEILLRNPDYLEKLTQHKRLAEFKSRQQFVEDEREATARHSDVDRKFDALRRYQHWELLRIGACDSFGLFDLKSVTVQLALLADSLVQSCLAILAAELGVSTEGFVVLAFGKLGGEELNYSSDIDLVFLTDKDATRFWTLGQRLIKALTQATAEGFLYRVDMRLRPWGRSGALVNTVDAHVGYLQQHGMLWEKQALLKARVIAGDMPVGREFLKRVEPLVFGAPVTEVRATIRGMKEKIESELDRQGRKWGEVKSGRGSIRDIEFVTQFLQLAHGGQHREVRSFNTLDGLVRLADFGFLHADEFRRLSSGYVFLRTIEHSLQLMHYKQTHTLPSDRRELGWLARRLDYMDGDHFVRQYEQHRDAIRAIYTKYIATDGTTEAETPVLLPGGAIDPRTHMEPSYAATFTSEEIDRHAKLLKRLGDENIVTVDAVPLPDGKWQVTIAGFDFLGDLSIICGLLFVHGFNIVSGNAFSEEQVSFRKNSHSGSVEPAAAARSKEAGKFVDVFEVEAPAEVDVSSVWTKYQEDLTALLREIRAGRQRETQGALAKRVAGALRETREPSNRLSPVEIEIDNEASPRSTVLRIRSEDTIGFLYELANALALTNVNVSRVIVMSHRDRVFDTLFVTDPTGNKIVDPNRQRELRAAVVLIKHFTHLLPHSPNPEAALLHFQEFLEQLFEQPNWLEELSSLERSDVLDALARLLGVSNFLWQDFLRLQHENLFPVVKDIEKLGIPKTKQMLAAELDQDLAGAASQDEARKQLNAFKDREMFRADMRHILGHVSEFGAFSAELTDVAEVVVAAATRLCDAELAARYGRPQVAAGGPSRLSVCALGKCGGRELGFASDIELMFLYDEDGQTTGPEVITNAEFYQKLVENFTHAIRSRQEGIFQIDLRLRPYGRAGSLAVSLDAFEKYFGPDGAAWPYERQALVKLRPIAADELLGMRIVELRDRLIFTGEPFDTAAMRAMREKQLRQLVQAGTVNAKLSPGALVDCEYLVQGLQITYGKEQPSVRRTNTLEAMRALADCRILSPIDYRRLKDAYIFQRNLIDALRVVRGHARDLTVPPADSEEFGFLARRLGYGNDSRKFARELESWSQAVVEMGRLLEQRPGSSKTAPG